MPPSSGVKVVGLDELRRDLRRLDAELPRELAIIHYRVAQIVADEARHRAPRGPHQGGGVVVPIVQSIRAGRQQRRATVSMGGARSPHAEPTEFGGTLRRFHSTSRTRVRQRAFLYPAIAAKRGEVIDAYGGMIDQLLTRVSRGR